jgi:hypothetical protein
MCRLGKIIVSYGHSAQSIFKVFNNFNLEHIYIKFNIYMALKQPNVYFQQQFFLLILIHVLDIQQALFYYVFCKNPIESYFQLELS